ncbi:hypothetical protein COL516b_001852 [Colletotrichum fioriniae]|nr:uncharacterized protein COL516b_001852 [Colletotrichum fioriniae]KAJ0311148.1 hypothetical protein COL516b_001852 [Colletotrichum fioriniae]
MLFILVAIYVALATAQSTPWPKFGNWTEEFNGHLYILSGPMTPGKKTDFELERCHYVLKLLNERTHVPNSQIPLPTPASLCMDILAKRKASIRDQGFLELFSQDIEDAKKFCGISEEHLEAERQHIIVEVVNLSLKAQEDVRSGRFRVPAPPAS